MVRREDNPVIVLEELVERARSFAAQVEAIGQKAERRRQLELGGWPEPGSRRYAEWKAAGEAVEQFYAAFGKLVEEARAAIDAAEPWIGQSECGAIRKRIHPSAVKSTYEALEWALNRAREFAAAEASGRAKKRLRHAAAAPPERQAGTICEAHRRHSPEGETEPQRIRPAWVPAGWYEDESGAPGRWVTATEFARIAGIQKQTLANWRWRDRRAGRKEAEPSKPRYRYFGTSVRYWLPAEIEGR